MSKNNRNSDLSQHKFDNFLDPLKKRRNKIGRRWKRKRKIKTWKNEAGGREKKSKHIYIILRRIRQ